MSTHSLDRLLTAFAGRLHASSICKIQNGWQLTFPAFDAMTIHFVLQGSGCVQMGGVWQSFAPRSMIVVPPQVAHVLSAPGQDGRKVAGGEQCSPFADGLIAFTAGDGAPDVLMVCGSIPREDGRALGLADLLSGSPVKDFAGVDSHHLVFDRMLAEVTSPTLGTQAMVEALMQQCFILLQRWQLLEESSPLPAPTPDHPRLLRAVFSIMKNPAAQHSVEALAATAGMGRTTFAEKFSRTFGEGPIEFVLKARLRAAARLLTTTDLPVKVIATSVGYASRSHFSRAFAAIYGTDPTSFRSNYGEVKRQQP